MSTTLTGHRISRSAIALPAVVATIVVFLSIQWPPGLTILILASLVPLGLLVDYRKAYLVWLFTLPFLRNFINLRTPLFDLKPSYLLLFVVVVGWSHEILRSRNLGLPTSRSFKLLYTALALMIAVTIIAVLASASPAEGIRAIPRTIYIAAVVLTTAHVLDSYEASLKAVRVCTISLIVAIVLGFVFFFTSLLPGGYNIDMKHGWPPEVTVTSEDLGEAYELGDNASWVHRYSAGFNNLYDTTGDFAFVGALLCLGWAGSRQRINIPAPWAWIVLFGAALLLTYSRGAWLSAAVGLVTLFALPRGQWRLRVSLVTVVALAIWLSPRTIAERAITLDISVFSRIARVLFSLDIIRAHPVLGVGPGVFSDLLSAAAGNWQKLGVDPDEAVTAHSAILQHVGEEGMVGLASLSFLFVLYIVLGYRLIRRARGAFAEHTVACAVFAAFVGFLFHCLVLPSFEDLLWATYAVGFVCAAQAMSSPSALMSDNHLRH